MTWLHNNQFVNSSDTTINWRWISNKTCIAMTQHSEGGGAQQLKFHLYGWCSPCGGSWALRWLRRVMLVVLLLALFFILRMPGVHGGIMEKILCEWEWTCRNGAGCSYERVQQWWFQMEIWQEGPNRLLNFDHFDWNCHCALSLLEWDAAVETDQETSC